MQDSWQVFMKPAMSAAHVDAAFQAGVHATTTSMAGRVLFPFPRWSDIGETDDGAHGKRAGNTLVTMPHTATTAMQNPAEGNGDCKAYSSMVDVSIRAGQSTASGLVCATETKKGEHTTATQHDVGTSMAVVVAGCGKADHGHNASAFSRAASSPSGTMNVQNDNKMLPDDGGVRNSKCKQQHVGHNNPTAHAAPRCQIDGCKQDLSKAKKEYHRRHKVCEMHSKASSVLKSGLHQRFCQQCSRFHVVGDFDDAKRSCRRRLEGHNRRRRKPISQGYGNMIGINPIMQHQLMAAATMMVPLQQQLPLNQGKSNNEANNIQPIQYEKRLAMPRNILPMNFDERCLAFLTYNTKGSSSSSSSTSSSSSPSSILNHGDTTCALSLLSCHASLDQSIHRNIEENLPNPNLSSNLTTTNHFTFPNTTNSASMINLNANNSIVMEYPQHSQSIHPTIGKVESSSFVESTKDLPYAYPLANYLENLGSLQSLEQHYNANLIAELLRQHQA